MKTWGIGLMSNEEKRSILDQHKSLYDGYRTMQPQVSNTQPLYVQDFANDKGGITVNNKFNVKPYTNMGINESLEKESMCSECGGMVYEGECSECGWKGDVGEEMQQVKDLKNVEDLNLSDKFDYTEEELDEISIEDLKKGKKYKFKHPAFSDEIEYEDEIDSDLDKIYKFRGKETHAMPKKGVESFVDYLDEDDALDVDAMQSVTGQEAPHMTDDMAPDGMDNDSDYDRKMMADGEVDETQQGNPYDNEESAYDFVSGGPLQEYDPMESAWSDDNEGFEEVTSDYGKMSQDDEFEDDFDSTLLDGLEDEEYDADIDILDEIEDEDLKESVILQKNKINEMFNRMKRF